MINSGIFALDIGTRKIAGLLLEKNEDKYIIKHALQKEQRPGAMKDGQIHDIPKVAQTIREVKEQLENMAGVSFNQAAVAAAGRSLLTQEGESYYTLFNNQSITSDALKTLELDAVKNALERLPQTSENKVNDRYLCVGYSVVEYKLDGQVLASLIGQQGARAEVTVIATFLPRIVVQSLSASLNEAGLDMASLTLEPIAAIQTVVPSTMRMLNIALVDIGAGTSDIAISSEGTVINYGMVSVAGDEVTECISRHYLLDFMIAESLKRKLTDNVQDELTCEDAFGNSLKISRDELLEVIKPLVGELAVKISDEIKRLNNGSPKGVILVGGGSQTPLLDQFLAEELSLPQHLVRVREREAISFISGCPDFSGPQTITPIAVGYTHLNGLTMELQKATINQNLIQFLRFPDSTIADALIYAGFSVRNLIGQPGKSITIKLNGQKRTIPGDIGKKAGIYCNGEPASLDTKLTGNDIIEIEQPKNGEDAKLTLGDIVETSSSKLTLFVNGKQYELESKVLVNNKPELPSYVLQDGDDVFVNRISTIGEVLTALELPTKLEYTLFINGKRKVYTKHCEIRVNNKEVSVDEIAYAGMRLEYELKKLLVKDLAANTMSYKKSR